MTHLFRIVTSYSSCMSWTSLEYSMIACFFWKYLASKVNAVLTSLNLANNQLCGLWRNRLGEMEGTYDASGITALASAISVNAVMKKCDMRGNSLGADEKQMLRDAVKGRDGLELLV